MTVPVIYIEPCMTVRCGCLIPVCMHAEYTYSTRCWHSAGGWNLRCLMCVLLTDNIGSVFLVVDSLLLFVTCTVTLQRLRDSVTQIYTFIIIIHGKHKRQRGRCIVLLSAWWVRGSCWSAVSNQVDGSGGGKLQPLHNQVRRLVIWNSHHGNCNIWTSAISWSVELSVFSFLLFFVSMIMMLPAMLIDHSGWLELAECCKFGWHCFTDFCTVTSVSSKVPVHCTSCRPALPAVHEIFLAFSSLSVSVLVIWVSLAKCHLVASRTDSSGPRNHTGQMRLNNVCMPMMRAVDTVTVETFWWHCWAHSMGP